MIEEILSPDLRLQRQRDIAVVRRLDALKHFKIGDHVQGSKNGYPGILEGMSADGFVSIRWPDGSLLCGVAGDDLVHSVFVNTVSCEAHCAECGAAFYDGECARCQEDDDGSLLWFCDEHVPQD